MNYKDYVDDVESSFPFPELIETRYFQDYKKGLMDAPSRGFGLGVRNYYNLLSYLNEIYQYSSIHANRFKKRFSKERDWKNLEAVFSEIIVYRYYIRLVYEEILKSIEMVEYECDIILELHDSSKLFLEVFCIMPDLQKLSRDTKFVVNDIKTHTQKELSSVRQKLLRKIEKQKQFAKPRTNIAVIELNDWVIAGDFSILSSLSNGYKIWIDNKTMEKKAEGYDWSNSVFDNESTKYLSSIIYFDLGDYENRRLIKNPNFKEFW